MDNAKLIIDFRKLIKLFSALIISLLLAVLIGISLFLISSCFIANDASKNDSLLDEIWTGKSDREIVEIDFNLVRFEGKRDLMIFDKLFSKKENFHLENDPKYFYREALRVKYSDGTVFTSCFASIQQDKLYFIVTSLLDRTPPYFEFGYDFSCLNIPSELKGKMNVANQFIAAAKKRSDGANHYLKLIIEDDKYKILIVDGLRVYEKKFLSSDAILKFMNHEDNMP